jgi:hypothetical protein
MKTRSEAMADGTLAFEHGEEVKRNMEQIYPDGLDKTSLEAELLAEIRLSYAQNEAGIGRLS